MLQIHHLTLTDRETGRVWIQDLSLHLQLGDRVAVIGEEGNGKSTLLRCIARPDSIRDYCEMEGDITREGLRLGFLEQEADRSLLTSPVAEVLAGIDLFDGTIPRFWELGIDPEMLGDRRPMGTLSGGERVKVRLLRLLADRPDLLLLDEPTNDLDIEALEWLERFILNAEQPVMYVSHDETLLERTANVILHIEQIRKKTVPRHTIERIGYADYVRGRAAALDKQEQVARKQRADQAKKMERWRQIYARVDHEQESISRQDPGGARLLKKKMKAVKAQGRRFEREAEEFFDIPDTEDAINLFFPPLSLPRGKRVADFTLDQLRAGDRVLAHGVKLTVFGGERVGLIGRNGAGKSTLLRLLWQSLSERRDLHAGWMPQQYDEQLNLAMTPVELLASSGSKEEVTRARSGLGSLKFTQEEMLRPAGELSGGQKAKLLLLRLILTGCDVLLLDEPTRNLSPLSNPVIRRALAGYGGTILCVSHDRKLLSEVCTVIYELTESGLSRRELL